MAMRAWTLLDAHYERVLEQPADVAARAAMQLGAFYAGTAIELSMLGATHACANPLTAKYGTTHGDAIAILLPHVIRWNGAVAGPLYAELVNGRSSIAPVDDVEAAEVLARRVSTLARSGGLLATLRDAGAATEDLPELAREAAGQWTGTFNPRPFDADGALEIYACAF
jgi:alcohol dehydrogenase